MLDEKAHAKSPPPFFFSSRSNLFRPLFRSLHEFMVPLFLFFLPLDHPGRELFFTWWGWGDGKRKRDLWVYVYTLLGG